MFLFPSDRSSSSSRGGRAEELRPGQLGASAAQLTMTGKVAASGGAGLRIVVVVLALFVSQAPTSVDAQLDQNYYVGSCPNVENLVNQWLVANVFTDPTGPAALVRLVFHDCQVNVSASSCSSPSLQSRSAIAPLCACSTILLGRSPSQRIELWWTRS